jgi:hypothetical protein
VRVRRKGDVADIDRVGCVFDRSLLLWHWKDIVLHVIVSFYNLMSPACTLSTVLMFAAMHASFRRTGVAHIRERLEVYGREPEKDT